jgi:transposase InsO family protein/transposase-like protein
MGASPAGYMPVQEEALMQRTSRRQDQKQAKTSKRRSPRGGLRGRRFSKDEKDEALKLIANGMKKGDVANKIGTTTESLLRWEKKAKADGTMPQPLQTQKSNDTGGDTEEGKETTSKGEQVIRSPYAPHDPGQGLADHEQEAILDLKKKRPSYQPAQIKAHLKRFKGWRISIKAIAKVLKDNGYELVHRGSRPEGPEPIRFEAPHRNALWHLDFTEVRVMDDKLHVLVLLDDYSRYVTGHAITESPTSQGAVETLKAAIARHGKPEAVRTDRGGAFVAYCRETDFGRYLEAELIDHIVGRSYRPQGGGKVESAIGTLKRELWDVFHFSDRQQAEHKVAEFFDEYNERRAHMGIDGLTPADRYFGRGDKVLAAINAISRKRQGAAAMLGQPGGVVEEIFGLSAKAPLEVLRLVINDGVMELRFCGARVTLGTIEN